MLNNPSTSDAIFLSDLTQKAKKKAGRQEIDRLYPDRSLFLSSLRSPLPKVRKNAARLLGALHHPEDCPALAEALCQETILYVIPSLILALGSIQNDTSRAVLSSYSVPKTEDPADQIHLKEISYALSKALSYCQTETTFPPFQLSETTSCLLRAPDGFTDILCQELSEKGYVPIRCAQGAFLQILDLNPLYSVRCMKELLIPIGSGIPVLADSIARQAAPWMTIPYRIELKNYQGNRSQLIHQIASHIPAENSPSHYSIELRIECNCSVCNLYCRPCNIPDSRFLYRKESLPASIAPETAACLSRIILGTCVNPEPYILDPFCGSATLLIECFQRNPHCHLIGIDRSSAAIHAARVNSSAANAQIRLIQKDIRAFRPDRKKVDLILSNLPFGNRVGTHQENESLYSDFARKIPDLIEDQGTVLLYTTDAELLHRCLASVQKLKIVDMIRTSAGGLLPWVFLIRKCNSSNQ